MSTQEDVFEFSQIPEDIMQNFRSDPPRRRQNRNCKNSENIKPVKNNSAKEELVKDELVEVELEKDESVKEELVKNGPVQEKPQVDNALKAHIFLCPQPRNQKTETAPKKVNFEVSSTCFIGKAQSKDREIQAVVEVKDAQTQTDLQDEDLELYKELRKKQFIRNNLEEVSMPIRGYIGPTIGETNRKRRPPLRIGLSNMGKNKKQRRVIYPDDAA